MSFQQLFPGLEPINDNLVLTFKEGCSRTSPSVFVKTGGGFPPMRILAWSSHLASPAAVLPIAPRGQCRDPLTSQGLPHLPHHRTPLSSWSLLMQHRLVSYTSPPHLCTLRSHSGLQVVPTMALPLQTQASGRRGFTRQPAVYLGLGQCYGSREGWGVIHPQARLPGLRRPALTVPGCVVSFRRSSRGSADPGNTAAIAPWLASLELLNLPGCF